MNYSELITPFRVFRKDEKSNAVVGGHVVGLSPATTLPVMTSPNPAPKTMRDLLRSIVVVNDQLLEFDTTDLPADPYTLFGDWLTSAIESAVSQPAVMTLATASADGRPSARTLVVKDVSDDAFWFATSTDSPKGQDLAANPSAAAVFFWREVGRQIRITGRVEVGPDAVSEADFLHRHPNARASVIGGDQSRPLPAPDEVERRLREARAAIEADPDLVAEAWKAYKIIPDTVEFMQMNRTRPYTRLLYSRADQGWSMTELWQ